MSDIDPASEHNSESRRYLFHKQETDAPERRTRKRPPNPKKPGTHKTVGHKHFMDSVRNAALVLVLMGIVLGLAILTIMQVQRMQQKRNAKLLESHTISRTPVNEQRADILDLLPEEEGRQGPLADQPTSLDVEAIRRAVYLSKRGNAFLASDDYEGAVSEFQQALAVWPYLGDVWASLGAAYIELENYIDAEVALQRAARIKGDDAQVLTNLGISHLYQQKLDSALDLFEAAQQIDGSSRKVYLYMARCHIAAENFGDAERDLAEYLKFAPSDALALKEKAFLEANRGRYDLALTTIKKAIAETPDWAELYWDAAGLCALIGRLEDSIRFLERGEAFTGPDVAYKIYQEQAFRMVRNSDLGRIYERELAERARRQMKLNQR